MINKMTADLVDRGWEKIARVRENDDNISVLFLMDDDAIAGITVMVADGGENAEVIFVNVAGRIDLELLGEMGMKVGLPGLEALGDIDWQNLDQLDLEKSAKKRGRRRGSH
jgi:hypothetical protein